MRAFTKAVLTAAAVAGTMTAGTAAPATAQTDLTTQVLRTHTGIGWGWTESSAVDAAQRNAETWAHLDGYNPPWHCYRISSSVWPVEDDRYMANVMIQCGN